MFKLVVFDMDGTVADTSPGILNSHRHAHRVMGWPVPSDETLAGVIGGPLLQTYIERFGFPPEDARTAVAAYRKYYSEFGIQQAILYPGMAETLRVLSQNGFYVAMATLKAESFAKRMLENMDVADCFAAVYGMDEGDTRTKAQLIGMCMDAVGAGREETLMVGDSIHDQQGADACNICFLGVKYGFGFKPGIHYDVPMVNHAAEIAKFVMDADCASG